MPLPGALGKASAVFGGLLNEVAMAHRFTVTFDNGTYNLGSWSKVSGLSVTWTTCEYRAGNINVPWIYPGPRKYPNIKFARAACADSKVVQQWLVSTTRNNQPLTGTIQLLDWTALPIVEWEVKQCFPVGWSITDFDSGGGKAVTETLELAHTGFLNDESK